MKRAFLVGINYPGTANELRGCVNDVLNIEQVLKHYQFDQITKLLDNEATTQNILNGLYWLVNGAKPGDVLYFHYSGHGSQIIDTSNDEIDGLDEIIVPADIDWRTKLIRDDDLKKIFNQVPAGVNLTVSLDCCNSGSGLDQANQYQPYGPGEQRIFAQEGSRYLPPPVDLTLLEKEFGFKSRSVQSRDVNQTGLLLTGCQAYQTSADAYIDQKYQGAFTYALCRTLREANYVIDYKTLIIKVNDFMKRYGFSQRPELNGSAALFETKFVDPYDVQVSPSQFEPQPIQTIGEQPPSLVEQVASTISNNQSNIIKIVGTIAIIAALVFIVSQ